MRCSFLWSISFRRATSVASTSATAPIFPPAKVPLAVFCRRGLSIRNSRVVAAAVARQHRMQRGRRNTATIELVYLILHQRDERRHDERRSPQHDRLQLIAERLARSGGHHGEHITTAEHGGHQLLLPRSKCLVAEMLLERRQQFAVTGRCRGIDRSEGASEAS